MSILRWYRRGREDSFFRMSEASCHDKTRVSLHWLNWHRGIKFSRTRTLNGTEPGLLWSSAVLWQVKISDVQQSIRTLQHLCAAVCYVTFIVTNLKTHLCNNHAVILQWINMSYSVADHIWGNLHLRWPLLELSGFYLMLCHCIELIRRFLWTVSFRAAVLKNSWKMNMQQYFLFITENYLILKYLLL